ncbi:MAG: BMP family ABC transporter substrate-binding protein, partial [Candidatus Neomarinimicrobiota bacterium]
MKRKLLFFGIVLLLVGLMTACDKTDDKPLKVVYFVNGELGDMSFFDSAQRGIDQAEEDFNVESTTIEAGYNSTLWETALEDAANDEDYDIFITGSYQMNTFLQ